jgi:hypothetical protein
MAKLSRPPGPMTGSGTKNAAEIFDDLQAALAEFAAVADSLAARAAGYPGGSSPNGSFFAAKALPNNEVYPPSGVSTGIVVQPELAE